MLYLESKSKTDSERYWLYLSTDVKNITKKSYKGTCTKSWPERFEIWSNNEQNFFFNLIIYS